MRAPGYLLVDPRIVRRVIKDQRHLSGLGIHIPHDHCTAIGRARLIELASERELGQAPSALPEELVLVAREAGLSGRELWRRRFHGLVHLSLDARRGSGELSEAAVRARIHAIGQTEFDEIRSVLRQEDLISTSRDDGEVFVEFAATYLEHRRFSPEGLARLFPTIRDHDSVEAVLALEVDAEALLAASKPEGEEALGQLKPVEPQSEDEQIETHAPPPLAPLAPERVALRARGDLARASNNLARAAICACRASMGEEGKGARGDVEALAARVAAVTGEPGHRDGWARAIEALVAAAAARPELAMGREARLLFDLQRACADGEEVKRSIDVMGWLLSFGRRPVVRELPAARLINVVRRLQSARQRAGRVRVETAERLHLQHLISEALHSLDHQLRAALGPKIREVFLAVGLRPQNAPERTALRKLVDELLDQATSRGFIAISHLRDCVARSNLKLADLSGPSEWWRGDALLQADARLAVELDGVYRRGEIYLRGLQKVSSLFFGTAVGRALTLHLLLPSLASFVALEGLQHVVGPLSKKLLHLEHPPHLLSPVSLACSALFIYGLIHSKGFRKVTWAALRAVGSALHAVFVGLPRWVLHLGPVRAVLESRALRMLWSYALKPAAVVSPLYLAFARRLSPLESVAACVAVFFALTLALNTPPGLAIQERLSTATARGLRYLSRQAIPGLLALIGELSQRLVDGVDRVLYGVDERLRFRKGDSRASLVFKGAFGVVWFFVTYLVRLGINVLFEPQVNPIKHFPVVTVSHKVLIPMGPSLQSALVSVGLPSAQATSIAATTILVTPGAVGFLVWELKGNWDLYARNRSESLSPVLVGHHGETVGALLKPGFHSGTVPKLYAKMRSAIRHGEGRAGKYREQLRDVEHAIVNFIERELSALLAECEGWPYGPVKVASVDLGSNRIRISLLCRGLSPEPACIHFEEQSGLVVSQVALRGFIDRLPPEHRDLFEAALSGLYRLAGVDLCREQIEAQLGPDSPYDVADDGLVVWPGGDYQTELVYSLSGEGKLEPTPRGAPPRSLPPSLQSEQLLLARQPVSWASWLALWSRPLEVRDSLPSMRRVSLLP